MDPGAGAPGEPSGVGLVQGPAAVVFGAVVVAVEHPEVPVQAGSAEGVVEGVVEVGGARGAAAGRGDAAAVADPYPAVDLDPGPPPVEISDGARWRPTRAGAQRS